MIDGKSGVKDSESPTGKESPIPSDEGNHRVIGDERKPENIMAENKRKGEQITQLQEELSALREEFTSEKEERLEHLQSKKELSQKDKNEMASLEEQIATIKRDPRSAPWSEWNKEISSKVAKGAVSAYDQQMTELYVQDLAEKEGVSFDKFEKDIVRHMQAVDPHAEQPTYVRAHNAYKRMQKEKELLKREKELEEKEKKFMETPSRSLPVNQSKEQIMSEGLKDSRKMEMLLAGVAAVQAEKAK